MQILSAYLLATVSGGGYAGNMLPENLLNLSNWEKNGNISIQYADGKNNVTVRTDARGEYIQLHATGLESGKMYEFCFEGCLTSAFPGFNPSIGDYVGIYAFQNGESWSDVVAGTNWNLTPNESNSYSLDFVSTADTALFMFDFGHILDNTVSTWLIENIALYEVN